MNRLWIAAGLISALLAGPGCQLISDPLNDVVLGTLGLPDDVDIQVPDTVTAGTDFNVEVRTIGLDGCWRDDRTEVTVGALRATVSPYDLDGQGFGHVCTQALVRLGHTATLSFPETGVATVEITGRDGTVLRTVVVE